MDLSKRMNFLPLHFFWKFNLSIRTFIHSWFNVPIAQICIFILKPYSFIWECNFPVSILKTDTIVFFFILWIFFCFSCLIFCQFESGVAYKNKKTWEALNNKLWFEQKLHYWRPGLIINQNEGQLPDATTSRLRSFMLWLKQEKTLV